MFKRKWRHAYCVLGLSFCTFSIPITSREAVPTGAIGQNFADVPAGSGVSAISSIFMASAFTNGINGFSGQIYFDGTSLWITSAANQQAQKVGQYQTGIWPTTAFETSTSGCAASYGYGTFHFKGQVGYAHSQLDQGPGANYILWNADNSWLSAKNGAAVSEFDLLETSYADNGQGMATAHFYNPSSASNNGQIANESIPFSVNDFTYPHNYDVVWTDSSMIEYVDGVPVLTIPTVNLPKDYAHGGCNKTLGFQMAMQAQAYDKMPTAQLLTQEVWWSPSQTAPTYGSNPPPPPPVQTNALSITSPTNVIAGQAFSITGTDNYNLTDVILIIDGASGAEQTPVISGTSFTVNGPATLTAGSHTAQVKGQDGTLSNTITFSVAAANGNPTWTGLHIDTAVLTGSTLTVQLEKNTGGLATIRIKVDGNYLGVVKDNAPDGVYNINWTLSPIPAAGTHTVTLYVDGTAISDTASFSVAASPTPPTQSGGLAISNVAVSGSHLTFIMVKSSGDSSTIKIKVDGEYLGTVIDHCADGTYNINWVLASVPASGLHTVEVYEDGSSIMTAANFTER